MIKFGVFGFGYWGPNVVRNLTMMRSSMVKSVCDINPKALKNCKELYRHIDCYRDYRQLMTDRDIDAVAIVTPVDTHFELAKEALENGKHVFVEKPFTRTVKEAEVLIQLAEKKKLTLMVDHVFLFTAAVRKIKDLISKNTLGELYYYDSLRSSLGLFRSDVNVVSDLATHDFSIIHHVIKQKPVGICAQGVDHMGRGHENIAYITVYFNSRFMAHISVNWLSPVKIRTTLIGGQKKMLVWDDLLTDEKIRIYDKGVTVTDREGTYRLRVDYRSGDMWSPHLNPTEALKTELEYLVRCIKRNQRPINDGYAGLRIVKMLEATNRSLKSKGKMIKL